MPTDLQAVLPDFDATPFSHLLPSLARSRITTADLLTLDPADLARRAHVPPPELTRLAAALLDALHSNLNTNPPRPPPANATAEEPGPDAVLNNPSKPWATISTLDDRLDAALGGGIPTGYVTEITGESGAGKTQFLLTLLLAVQAPAPAGLDRSALYISTEAALSTPRLAQLLSHPRIASLPDQQRPSLARVLGIQTPDLEVQDHIIRYQVPVAIARHNVGLIILDSVAANFRAELDNKDVPNRPGAAMARRSAQLIQLGALLRDIARRYDVAIVVANQVADRFQPNNVSATGQRLANMQQQNMSFSSTPFSTPPDPDAPGLFIMDQLTLDHQQRWFTGWGDQQPGSHSSTSSSDKTPSLGLVWTNQIACRIALIKDPVYSVPSATFAILDRLANPNVRSNPAGAGAAGASPHVSKGGVNGLPDGHGDNGNDDHHSDSDDGRGGTEIIKWRRWFKLVFAPWVAPSVGRGIEFEISKEGIRSVKKKVF